MNHNSITLTQATRCCAQQAFSTLKQFAMAEGVPAVDQSSIDDAIEPMSVRTLVRSEQGMITWGTLLSVMLLMVLVSLVSNTAIVVNKKIETQNSADAVAYSSSVWLARGMNGLTATNHVMGELNALYTIHHALGGKWLDEHYQDEKKNNGDWHPTWPAPFGHGGIPFQMANYVGIDGGFYTASALCIVSIISIPFMPDKDHYDRIRKNPVADIHSAIFEGKELLKYQLVAAYALHIKGATEVLQGEKKVIDGFKLLGTPAAVAGAALIAAGLAQIAGGIQKMRNAKKIAKAINLEYTVLDAVEDVAIELAGVKLKIPGILKLVYLYQQASVNIEIPAKTLIAAKKVAGRNNCDGFAVGDLPGDATGIFNQITEILPKMPVEPEKVTNEGRSQMVRATYPWVRKWRFNIHAVLAVGAPTSLANFSFLKWTNKYAKQSSEWLRTDGGDSCDNELTVKNRRGKSNGEKGKGIKMYVIYELNEEGHKSEEIWNKPGKDGTKKADDIFCLMGFAKTGKPAVLSGGIFRQENPHGFVCFAQAMIYNASPQQTPATGGEFQPAVSWDTLAWDHERQRVKEWKDPGFFGLFGEMLPEREPKIKLNWQAKLTPVTMRKTTRISVPASFDPDVRAVFLNCREGVVFLQNH